MPNESNLIQIRTIHKYSKLSKIKNKIVLGALFKSDAYCDEKQGIFLHGFNYIGVCVSGVLGIGDSLYGDLVVSGFMISDVCYMESLLYQDLGISRFLYIEGSLQRGFAESALYKGLDVYIDVHNYIGG